MLHSGPGGLTGWWRLDGDANDYSGNNVHGNVSGATSFANGKIGQCLSMDSSSGQVITPIKDNEIPDTFTATAWVKIKQWGLSQGVFGTRASPNGFMLYRNSGDADGLLRTYLHYTNTSGTATTTSHQYTSFPLNQWFHVAVVRGHGYYKTYLNGVLVGHTVVSNFSHWNKGSTTFRIGAGGSSYQSAQMDVDDVRLYTRELSLKEIRELSMAKILHYKFDDFQEPTENVVTNTDLDTGWSKEYCTGIQWNDIPPPLGVDSPVVSFYDANTDQSGYWYSYGDYAPQVPGETYTVSLYVKTRDSNFRIRFYTADNSETGRYTSEYITVPNDGNWHRVVWNSFINPSNSQSDSLSFQFNFGSPQGEGQRTWLCAPQMEAKPYATPFTPGTRGGVVLDSSGYENHAALSISTTPQWSSDSAIGSGAYEFVYDTRNNHIRINNLPNVTHNQTIAMWLYPFSNARRRNPWNRAYGGEGTITHEPDGTLHYYYGTHGGNNTPYQPINSGQALPLNQWSHIAVVRDLTNGRVRWYINGVKTNEATADYPQAAASSAPVLIGTGYTSAYDGRIDDVRLYATALSDEDIKELYQQRASIDNRGHFHVHELVETGYMPSLIDYRTWRIGDTQATGFSRNGAASENNIIDGTDPWGNITAIWEARPAGDNNDDGGWNTSRFSIDNTKLYRFSVWVNRTVMGSNGIFYLGCHGYGSTNGVRTSSGSINTNPYFYSGRDLPEGEWVLVVGHVHPHHLSSFSVHPDTGIWRLNGTKIRSITDFQWLPETIEAAHRTYLYYTTDTTVRQRWCYPRVDVCDGNEPTLADLLSGRPYLYDDIPGPMSLTDRMTYAPKISEVGVVAGISAWYPLRENVFDISGSKNHLTVNGPSLSTVSGRLGLFFDGVDDWAQIAQPIQFPGDQNAWTVTGWIYPTQSGWIISPRSSGNDHGIIYDGSNRRLRFYITQASNVGNRSRYSLNGSVPLNQWSHFACSLDGLLVRIYVNGELQYEGTETDPIALWSGAWDLGRRATGADYFGGFLSDLRIYKRPLSPQEVGILYKATRPNPVLMQQTASGIYIPGQLIEV